MSEMNWDERAENNKTQTKMKKCRVEKGDANLSKSIVAIHSHRLSKSGDKQ